MSVLMYSLKMLFMVVLALMMALMSSVQVIILNLDHLGPACIILIFYMTSLVMFDLDDRGERVQYYSLFYMISFFASLWLCLYWLNEFSNAVILHEYLYRHTPLWDWMIVPSVLHLSGCLAMASPLWYCFQFYDFYNQNCCGRFPYLKLREGYDVKTLHEQMESDLYWTVVLFATGGEFMVLMGFWPYIKCPMYW